MKKPEDYARTWTEAQWDDAERVQAEMHAVLGDAAGDDIVCLVIEERKKDPNTTIQAVINIVIMLGVERLFSLRHAAQNQSGCTVSPDVRKARVPQKRRKVRGV